MIVYTLLFIFLSITAISAACGLIINLLKNHIHPHRIAETTTKVLTIMAIISATAFIVMCGIVYFL